MVAGGHAWLPGGMCGCQGGGQAWMPGGMHGCRGDVCCVVAGGCVVARGVCVVAGGYAWLPGGHVWLPGGMHRCWGACMVARECAWLLGGMRRIRRDTVNERAVRILLECIPVMIYVYVKTKINLQRVEISF